MAEITIPVQRPVGADGLLLHEEDHVAQLVLAVENLESVLASAGLHLATLAVIEIHTTDRGLFDDASEVLTQRLAEYGVEPGRIVQIPNAVDPDALLAFADTPFGRDDLAVWARAAAVLPPSSPRLSEVHQHLDALDLALR